VTSFSERLAPARMRRIANERSRINDYKFLVGSAALFNDRKYRDDLEWLSLAYLRDILSNAGWEAPELAERLLPPAPDFQTFLKGNVPFRRVEIAEVLRPGYRRGHFYRNLAASGRPIYVIPNPHPEPWSSFYRVLRSKLARPYAAGSWLLIYHNMSPCEFVDSVPWHERMLNELYSWTRDTGNTCDITRSKYDSIFVVDSSGVGAIRLHPHWDVISVVPNH
jgi:hypothetical protein